MRQLLRRLFHETPSSGSERGQVLVLFAVGLIAFLGLVGLAADVGMLVYTRTDLQKTADASALAGAQDLLRRNTSAATSAANSYVTSNAANTSGAISFSTRSRSNDVITVTAQRHVAYSFVRLLGITGADPAATAAVYAGAAISVRSLGGMSVMPWAINNDAFISYGVSVGVQPANAQGGYGQYNLVSINPPNGQGYTEAMTDGVTAPVVIGGRYATNTFDGTRFSLQTVRAMNRRIHARPQETWQTFKAGSPRVVLLPVVNGNIPNAPTPVVIQTFRAFFLEKADFVRSVIYGRFVEVNAPGGDIPAPGQTVTDLGVRVIKLLR